MSVKSKKKLRMKSRHEKVGPENDLFDVEDTTPLTLQSIGQVIEGKLQKVAMKEYVESLRQTVVAEYKNF